MRRARFVFLVGATMCAIGCASTGRHALTVASRSLCVVTADELSPSSATSLFDALRVVRPSLLRSNVHGELPVVVVDGTVMSDAASVLQTLPLSQVYSARRLTASAATIRYGLNVANAGLEIRTHRSDGLPSDSAPMNCE